MIPAMICPITCGCRMYDNSLARTLQKTKVMNTCIRNVAKGDECGSSNSTTIVRMWPQDQNISMK